MLKEFLPAAEILKPQGLDGCVKARVDMDHPDCIAHFHTLYLLSGGEYAPIKLLRAQTRDGFGFLWLEGLTDRDAAEKMRGAVLFISRADAPPLPENGYYLADVPGLLMVNQRGDTIGTVRDVMQPCANDVFVVDTERGEMLVPVVPHVILKVKPEEGRVIVNEETLQEVAVFGD